MCIVETSPVSTAELPSLFREIEGAPAVVLAVSGGADSTALIVLAARWHARLKSPPKLSAVTIDHGLRKEARREAADVAKLARRLKIAHRTLRWTGKKPKTGLQQAARAARYRLLAQAARRAGATFIVTAHTRDDQAETVLIRMSRGSGITGLAAMRRVTILPYSPPRRKGSIAPTGPREARPGDGRRAIKVGPMIDAMTPTRHAAHGDLPLAGGGMEVYREGAAILLCRPLLDIPKSRLVATLGAAKIPFVDDPSNRDPRFTRARLRLLMTSLAAEGLSAERLAILAHRLKRADTALEAAVDHAAAEVKAEPGPRGAVVFDMTGFAQLPAEIALRLLGRAIAQVGDEGPVELAKLEILAENLAMAQKSGRGKFRRSLAGAIVTLRPPRILVERAPPRQSRAFDKGSVAKR